jgi:hypothetical protein
MRDSPDTSEIDGLLLYLKVINNVHGKIYCLNFLTGVQKLSLPDSILFYDCFIKQ